MEGKNELIIKGRTSNKLARQLFDDDLEAEVSVPGPSGKRKLSEIEV